MPEFHLRYTPEIITLCQSALYLPRCCRPKTLRSLAGLLPLTSQGLLTLVVSTWALRTFGYGSMDLVVFALTISALAILISCLFCTIGFGLFMQRRIRLEIARPGASDKVEINAGYPNETGFSIPATTFPPLVTLSWKIIFPDAIETRNRLGEHKRLYEEVLPKKRCLTDVLIREFSVRDVADCVNFPGKRAKKYDVRPCRN